MDLLLIAVIFIGIPTVAGALIFDSKRESALAGAVLGFLLAFLSVVGWVILAIIWGMWHPERARHG